MKFLWMFHSLQPSEITLTAQKTLTITVKLYVLPFKITTQYNYTQRWRTWLLHSLDKTTVKVSCMKHSTSKVQPNIAQTYNPSHILNLVHSALPKDLTIMWTIHTALLYIMTIHTALLYIINSTFFTIPYTFSAHHLHITTNYHYFR
jgi:hypothetical protein